MDRILVVEDEQAMREIIRDYLAAHGMECDLARDGQEALDLLRDHDYDAVALDVLMPRLDGFGVCRAVRKDSAVPILFLTALGGEEDVLRGYALGADDYVTKPFSAEELLARIRVGLRHKSSTVNHQEQEFCLDYFRLDFEKRKLYVHDQEVHLTPLEYKMMVLLVNNSGKVLTHHYIQQEVWGYDTTDDYQSLRVFMANIRRKIEDNTANPRFILTEVGVGYRFVDE